MTSTPPQPLARGPRDGFPVGRTPIAHLGDVHGDFGIDFSIVKQRAGDVLRETSPHEAVWVLLRGSAQLEFGGQTVPVTRTNVFDEPPSALHVGPHTALTITAHADGAEWAAIRTENAQSFSARLFQPGEIGSEPRGAGLVQEAALRNVRLIFDRAARPESNLVVGEVVNYPGRWSSYPPHHHDQPEIYHYRFTHPDGYGHAELGDDVVKVRPHDTVFIPPGLDHAQVSAPGYGMYYLWIIRHLPGNPYTGFTFAPEHTWTLDPTQQGWKPTNVNSPRP